jgi:hypothetical protein
MCNEAYCLYQNKSHFVIFHKVAVISSAAYSTNNQLFEAVLSVPLLLLNNHLLEMNSAWPDEASCHDAQDNFTYDITYCSLAKRLEHYMSDF